MNIAVIASVFISDSEKNDYLIVKTLFKLGLQKQGHKFFFITGDQAKEKLFFPPNIETINTRFYGKGGLIKKYLQDIKFSGILKKIKADVLVSFGGYYSLSLKIPQILIITEVSKISVSNLKKAKIITSISQGHKKELSEKYKIKEEKIVPVFAFANEIFIPATESVKEKIKEKYCEGKEYFLFPESNINSETFMDLLKSFSHFKKRQQSSMKLMILGTPGEKSIKSLLTYKYRKDVVITGKLKASEEADITGSSYAVLISLSDTQPVLNTLNALQCKIPVIAAIHPVIQELAGDAVLYSENESGKNMGDNMIRIYTDEKLRDQQIKKGETVVKNFSAQKTADHLWNCIEKAVK